MPEHEAPTTADSSTRRRWRRVVAEHGPYTAHDIQLVPGLTTLGRAHAQPDRRLLKTVAEVERTFGDRLDGVRVIDLGCLEGAFGLEMALRGADVTCVDARPHNLARARFAFDVRGARARFVTADVRELERHVEGPFDVVLCLGLLYHLDAASAVRLLATLCTWTRQLAVIETCIALSPHAAETAADDELRGLRYRERSSGAIPDDWTSVGNDVSFWPTRRTLLRRLDRGGLGHVAEVLLPHTGDEYADRVLLAARPHRRTHLLTADATFCSTLPLEHEPALRHPAQLALYRLARAAWPGRRLPDEVRRLAADALGLIGSQRHRGPGASDR